MLFGTAAPQVPGFALMAVTKAADSQPTTTSAPAATSAPTFSAMPAEGHSVAYAPLPTAVPWRVWAIAAIVGIGILGALAAILLALTRKRRSK